jgi:hypothetical protein
MAQSKSINKRPHHSGSKGRNPIGIRVRLPVFELFALRQNRIFGIGKARHLYENEIKVARFIFGKAINFKKVRILKASEVSSPTVIGNYIRTNDKRSFLGCPPIFIHELTHVWQFQTKGLRYISNSTIQQVKNKITGDDVGVHIIPGGSICNYTAEEQAGIVSDYYVYTTFQQVIKKLKHQGILLKTKDGKVAVLPIMERAEFKLTDEQEFQETIDRVVSHEREYDRLIGQVRQTLPLPENILQNVIQKEATWDEGIIKPPSGQRDGQPNPWIRIEF